MARADVTSQETGEWTVKIGGEPVAGQYKRQREAEIAARRLVRDQGGGEVVIHTRTGRLRDVQTVRSPNAGRVAKAPAQGNKGLFGRLWK
jgi:uncharacterized protein DUF2188